MKRFIKRIWRKHGTKIIGYSTVTAGILSTSSVVPQKAAGWFALLAGLITAWRGHTNTQAANAPTLTPKE